MAKKSVAKQTKKVKPFVLNITHREFVDTCNKRDDSFIDGMLEPMAIGGEMGGLAAMLAIESLIQQEERILRLEPKHEELPNEIRRYVEMRKKVKAALGKQFEELSQMNRKSHNECACTNLINSKGDRKSTRLNSSHSRASRMPSSA